MNFKVSTALAGLMLAVAATPAMASDLGYGYGGGSIKDMGGPVGIPVPAPVPVPIAKADYYIRGDVGIGFADSMSVGEQGLVYGQDAVGNDVTVPSSWVDDDDTLAMTFGIGVGRYWSDRFRTDFTIDWMRQQAGIIEGTMTYQNLAGEIVTVTTRDKTTKEGGIFLANAYYDMAPGARFNPYVGGGIGFALNIMDRHHETAEQICNACGGFPTNFQHVGDNKSTNVSLAAAAMVGFTYDLGRSMLLDVGYRYLYIGSSDSTVNVFNTSSKLEFDAQNEHQIRAGVRMNID